MVTKKVQNRRQKNFENFKSLSVEVIQYYFGKKQALGSFFSSIRYNSDTSKKNDIEKVYNRRQKKLFLKNCFFYHAGKHYSWLVNKTYYVSAFYFFNFVTTNIKL